MFKRIRLFIFLLVLAVVGFSCLFFNGKLFNKDDIDSVLKKNHVEIDRKAFSTTLKIEDIRVENLENSIILHVTADSTIIDVVNPTIICVDSLNNLGYILVSSTGDVYSDILIISTTTLLSTLQN